MLVGEAGAGGVEDIHADGQVRRIVGVRDRDQRELAPGHGDAVMGGAAVDLGGDDLAVFDPGAFVDDCGQPRIVEEDRNPAAIVNEMHRPFAFDGGVDQFGLGDVDIGMVAMVLEADAGADGRDDVAGALHGEDGGARGAGMQHGRAFEREFGEDFATFEVDDRKLRLGMIGDEQPPGADLVGDRRRTDQAGADAHDRAEALQVRERCFVIHE
jgi:hypothetical protein